MELQFSLQHLTMLIIQMKNWPKQCLGIVVGLGPTPVFFFMILVRHTPHFKAKNYLQSLTIIMDDIADVETTAE